MHLHDGLHVRFEEAGHDPVVQFAILSCLKLKLVDISILITDGAGDKSDGFGETLK